MLHYLKRNDMHWLLLTFLSCKVFAASFSTPPTFATYQEYKPDTSMSQSATNKSCDLPQNVIDYYWRDYYGIVPKDALPGGLDKTGETTYIGQFFITNIGLIPGTIYRGIKDSVTFTLNGQPYPSSQFVKILCCRNIEKFQWISTTPEDSALMIHCHLVVGGHQDGFVVNIGRVNHENEVVVGKVLASHLLSKGLSIPVKSGPEARYQKYEILAYNCKEHKDTVNSTVY